MLFAAPNLTCRTKLIQTPLFYRTFKYGRRAAMIIIELMS